MRSSSAGLCLIFTSLSGLGCLRKPAINADPSAVAQMTRLWSEPGKIPVCWFTTVAEPGLYPEERARVQELVSEQFDRTAAIRFMGWKDCEDRQALFDACIGKFPKPPQCVGLERKPEISILLTRRLPSGTFGVSSIGPEARNPPTMLLDPRNIEETAIHEFGHAIGLQHEHARTDSPRYVKDVRGAPEPDLEISNCPDYAGTEKVVDDPTHNKYLTDFDPDSVMNYCSRKHILSEKDLTAINQLYPN